MYWLTCHTFCSRFSSFAFGKWKKPRFVFFSFVVYVMEKLFSTCELKINIQSLFYGMVSFIINLINEIYRLYERDYIFIYNSKLLRLIYYLP